MAVIALYKKMAAILDFRGHRVQSGLLEVKGADFVSILQRVTSLCSKRLPNGAIFRPIGFIARYHEIWQDFLILHGGRKMAPFGNRWEHSEVTLWRILTKSAPLTSNESLCTR